MQLGDYRIEIIPDTEFRLDGGAMFGVVPRVLWERVCPPDELNRVQLNMNCVFIETPHEKILIETGIGNKLPEKMAQIYGQPAKLLDSLHAVGLAPEDVDIVINSHLHFDHCGWNTIRQNGSVRATFPNAKYYAQEGEWQHAHEDQRDSVSFFTENYDPLVESGQMQLLRGSAEIVPGISVEVYPGHTRDMQAIYVRGGGKTACYISDLIPTSSHLDLYWLMSFDLYPVQSVESRKRFYSRALPENWLVMFTHDHQIPWAYLQKDERGKVAVRDQAEV